jgi:Flp pilus assembly protein TadG
MKRYGRQRERGAALVEFAAVAPLLLLILFGIIEYGYIFMVRQTVTHAAREGCRIAVLQTTEEPYAEVTDRVAEIMATTGVTNYTVVMTHPTAESPMEAVQISVPIEEVSLVGSIIPHGDGPIRVTCSMRKEGIGSGG